MRKTIKIAGKDHQYDGLTEDRKGIKSDGRIFWMFPAVRAGGGSLESSLLPPIGPFEIRPVTTSVPDLTKEFPGTVSDLYERRRRYRSDLTLEKHLEKFPGDSWMSIEQFEDAKRRILNQTLEEFSISSTARREVWQHHGTPELAAEVGLIDFSLQVLIRAWLKRLGFSGEASSREINRLKWVALYDDPENSQLYLYDLVDEPDPKAAEIEMRRRELELAEIQKFHARPQIDAGGSSIAQEIDEKTKAYGDVAAQQKVYRITFVGAKCWRIQFGPHAPFFAVGHGIARELAYVFKKPHEVMHVLTVQHELSRGVGAKSEQTLAAAIGDGLSPQQGTHRIERVKLTPEKYTKAKHILEQQLCEARESQDEVGIFEIEDQLERLEQYQSDARHGEKDWSKLCNDRIRSNLKRFKAAIAKDATPGGKAFLDHIKRHLTLRRYKLQYHPPEDIVWTD